MDSSGCLCSTTTKASRTILLSSLGLLAPQTKYDFLSDPMDTTIPLQCRGDPYLMILFIVSEFALELSHYLSLVLLPLLS